LTKHELPLLSLRYTTITVGSHGIEKN